MVGCKGFDGSEVFDANMEGLVGSGYFGSNLSFGHILISLECLRIEAIIFNASNKKGANWPLKVVLIIIVI